VDVILAPYGKISPVPSRDQGWILIALAALPSYPARSRKGGEVPPRKTQLFEFHMSNIIPLISSGTAGPLGVLHLPRLWLKASLGAAGKLHSDYPAIGAGYDQMVLDGIGIDKGEFEAFIRDAKPSYIELENWILQQKGGSLDQDAVEKLNAAIVGYIHADATRTEILAAAGRSDDGTIKDAVNLNNLDDWATFHAAELK